MFAQVAPPAFRYLPDSRVVLESSTPGAVIRYTLEDRDPDKSAGVYFSPVDVPVGRVLRARAFSASGTEMSAVLTIAGRPQPSTLVEVTQNRDWKNYDWATRHRAIVARNQQVKPDLLLLGDSITHFWGGEPSDARARGPLSYEKYFGAYKVTNIGYGWDRTENVLWRLRHGEVDGIAPRVVMVMIGTNNMGLNTAEEITAGVTAICDELHLRLPEANILLLGIFPRGAKADVGRDKIAAVNVELAKLDGTRSITYMDIGKVFLEADGSIAPAIMNDYLHPTEAGYERWGEAIAPTLRRLAGK
ncbi:MAG: chitobiase/beta-hexosaminidase C-terminal domain-containing protein [Bryobacterales bacterium]|nr:chitobiase/beta-hexosaminidase C-terminal domain-containing protein [Bryobacterales bacterium]